MLAKNGDNAAEILARGIFGNSGKMPEISKTPRGARPLAQASCWYGMGNTAALISNSGTEVHVYLC